MQEPPTPEPEADPTLKALANEREALLRKLEQPSADDLTKKSVSEEAEVMQVEEPPKTEAPAKPVDGPSPSAESGALVTAASSDAGSQSNLSNAVSLSKHENWFKVFLRTFFVTFFGSLFAPFRRRRADSK